MTGSVKIADVFNTVSHHADKAFERGIFFTDVQRAYIAISDWSSIKEASPSSAKLSLIKWTFINLLNKISHSRQIYGKCFHVMVSSRYGMGLIWVISWILIIPWGLQITWLTYLFLQNDQPSNYPIILSHDGGAGDQGIKILAHNHLS